MRPTVFQRAELRDENDNIVQQGAYGKGSALSNSTNDAWIDYVMNNLEALRSMSVGAIIPVETLPESGETGKAYVVTTGTDAGKLFMWDGEDWVEITGSIGDYLPITGGTITGNLSITGNATLSGTSTAVTPAVDDNSTKVATTEYVQNEVKPIETDVTINDKRISNIEKLLQGNLYDYQTDNSSAYTKTVPSGAMPYAGLEKVGGKTVVWNQLYRVVDGSVTSYGVSIVRSSSASTYTVSGTANTTATIWLTMYKPDGTRYDDPDRLINGHKYATLLKGDNLPLFRHAYDGVNRSNKSYILTGNGSYGFSFGMEVTSGVTYNFTVKIMLIDLTLMFGAGNEPTIEQFEAMFPSDWYDATYGTLLSAGVTEVVSKDANNATLHTYSIPAGIQALEGYGWSAGTAYNYVDFERKVFVQNVARVNLGNLTWERYYNGTRTIFASSNYYLSPYFMKIPQYHIDYYAKANIVCNEYINISYGDYEDGKEGIFASDYIEMGGDNPLVGIGIYDTTKQSMSVANFKTSLDGVYLYYELATPVETDISQYITDDNLIQVESGGTLTFENQHGDDYQIHVPSEEEYMIDLQEAINNG